MKKKGLSLLAFALLGLAVAVGAGAESTTQSKASATTLSGAGSSFVSPLVSVWTPALGNAYDYTIQYSPTGSGAGISAISTRQVDFGASDAPLTPDQFTACNGCVQIPWALAGTAIPYNVPGISPVSAAVHLKLSGEVLAKIYMGQITNWNDAAIKKLNPTATMPDLKITPVYRTGNSGTTYNFTDYLSSASGDWKGKFGVGQAVNWPTGVGASGSAGVAGVVANTPGALCYVDTAFAVTNKLHMAAIQNRAGKFINPSIRNVAAAGNAVLKVPANNELHIVNPPKALKDAYPISTYTPLMLIPGRDGPPSLRTMVYWGLTQGQKPTYTAKLWFSPVPKVVLKASLKTLTQVKAT